MPLYTRSVAEKASRKANKVALASWNWIQGPGRRTASLLSARVVHQVRINLTARRLLSFPHLVVLFWLVILLWGERWLFDSKVRDCAWKNWEDWPKGATPHHLVLVADPQIVDARAYPSLPWPVSSLAAAIMDNYLFRGFKALQGQLHPDSVFFLGDLFDGGREWKTEHGDFVDPKWGSERPKAERPYVRKWHKRYGEDYWMREYRRFGDIFFDQWIKGGDAAPGAWQRGRKLVAGLPGNHDIGYGAMVQVPVRDRFSAFFGEGNRIDIVGNHSIVMVDTLSLSAGSSEYREKHDPQLRPIYEPVTQFLEGVKVNKAKLTREELDFWYGLDSRPKLKHVVEDVDQLDSAPPPPPPPTEPAPDVAELPTILLTHVPLYRLPEVPCGPKREPRPPNKLRKLAPGQDNSKSITLIKGYQYQNVLDEQDSVLLVKSVGNVVHVFSGDDHNYCEVVHSESKQNVREITVKSMAMNMGVSNPGFVMVSLYNPLDSRGNTLPGAPAQTLQTHLCLLPNQTHTHTQYITFGIVTLGILALRAFFLVPMLRLAPFALDPAAEHRGPVLPVHKEKTESSSSDAPSSSSHSSSSSSSSSMGFASSASAASRSGGGSRRSLSTNNFASSTSNGAPRWESKTTRHGKWAWSNSRGGPRIRLDDHFYDGAKGWKSDGREGRRLRLAEAGREMWTTSWRVAWMLLLFCAYLTRTG